MMMDSTCQNMALKLSPTSDVTMVKYSVTRQQIIIHLNYGLLELFGEGFSGVNYRKYGKKLSMMGETWPLKCLPQEE